MKVEGFVASADIVGRRVRVAWDFVPEDDETLADIPPVVLRRKQRDYAWPPVSGTDPYGVYDSNAFPPAPVPGARSVIDLAPWEVVADGERAVHEPVSVAIAAGGRFVEVLRRTTATVFDLAGVPLRQRVEIVDVGAQPGALLPCETYYYQLFSPALPAEGDAAAQYRGAAMVTGSYGHNRLMYQALPEVYRLQDVVAAPPAPGQDSVPELAPGGGQLRRFIDPFGIAVDALRGTAEGLRTLHDLDRVDARFLPRLAQWIGWDLDVAAEIPRRRNELKTASRLYAIVGTLPGLRSLVTQFTGWSAQVAEFAQNIALSNQPPARHVHATAADGTGTAWHGIDEAAERLGFGAANRQAAGAAGSAATLTGGTVQPFALRPSMTLSVAVDGLPPATVRFGRADFADIAQASAAEVAAVLARTLPELHARVVGGALVLASQTVGASSLLEVVVAPTSLVTFSAAPAGRLAACADAAGRLRLFFEVARRPTEATPQAAALANAAAAASGGPALRRLEVKTFVDGAWRDARPLLPQSVAPQSDPTATLLPDGRLWLAWLEAPQTAATRVRWALGQARTPQPARLQGLRTEPYALVAGTVLALAGHWSGAEIFTVHAADFANPGKATAAEVVAAMNAQFTRVVAQRGQNGSIALATVQGGALATLSVDLRGSTTARALGFDERNLTGQPGSWDDTLAGVVPLDATTLAPARRAEPCALADSAGGVRLVLASHRAGLWRLDALHWDEHTVLATAGGLVVRAATGAWSAIAGLPSNDVRAIAGDTDGLTWIATAAGVLARRPDGSLVAPLAGLPSPDARALALGRDGTLAIATAAGVALRAAGGALQVLDTGTGLPSNDVRALAYAADGTLWIGTAAGAVRRDPAGGLAVFNTGSSPALPAVLVQGLSVDEDGTAWVATPAGLALLPAGGAASVIDQSSGLRSADIRASLTASDGTLWVATAAGVARRAGSGQWRPIDTAAGLPSDDALSLAAGSGGTVWVGTASGLAKISADGSTTAPVPFGAGGSDPAVRALATGWSAPRELAAGGGGNREPVLALATDGRTWLVWSQRLGIGTPEDNWSLHGRIFDAAGAGWGAELTFTSPPPGSHAADHAPTLQPLPGGAMRIHFASDRDGGSSLWRVDVNAAGVAGVPAALPATGSSETMPTAVEVGGETWLLLRADASISLARAGDAPGGGPSGASTRASDNGTLRRHAGSVAADLRDLNRMRTRRVFDDLLCYTPNRPDNAGTLGPDELYTRGTVGLYVSQTARGAPLTSDEIARLREFVARFVPINLRTEVIVVEPADAEIVFPPGAGLTDSYVDDYPFVSALGPVADSFAAAMPGVDVLESNVASEVSANPADLATLRRRTWFPPLQ